MHVPVSMMQSNTGHIITNKKILR